MPINPAHLYLLDAEDKVRLTAEGQLVADWFIELSNARSAYCVGMAGVLPEPIKYSEIEAWARLTGNQVNRWALLLIRVLDAVFIDFAGQRLNNEIERQKMKK